MADLKTNYKDDVLDASKNEKRKFRMIQNDDGTVSFDDATEYTQQGDAFGAADINATNAKINEQSQSLGEYSSKIKLLDVRQVTFSENKETGDIAITYVITDKDWLVLTFEVVGRITFFVTHDAGETFKNLWVK